ncbi:MULTISPECIES: DUF484 family protein [Vibrio]|uniref:DUF484 family protein n=1 Tax=Vibrio paracholerae TaxID=650003 RepID=A0ABD7G0T0_9VIBR|nr:MULTISPECIES: DUF484 family protein [Vibrio]OFJ28445.1 3',5'-cyclic-nucleotide phosphodiesterase [Vibrio paracholerae]RBM72455.1 DUF484 family protein [Vibrio paracholerae]TXX52038.1 DUF484 family protein [Vibrio cholerae]TYA09751.1 DUF484 family protein [Vibrio cholerae]WOR00697.1 DUF484 family protein [Vibrio paracholerae]
MSQVTADALTAQVVAEYLYEHPDFFQHHAHLVERLALPTQAGAVSLAHVQLARQRQRIDDLEEEITALMSLAANNDRTFHEFMDLQEQMLKCSSLQAVLHAIEAKARELNLRAYILLLQRHDEKYGLVSEDWQRFATNHFNGKSAYLGRLRQADRQRLLGDRPAPEMGSYVVLPLQHQTPLGILAFASEDGGHFQPSMDTLFLRHMALILAHLIETLPWQSHDEERRTHPAS